jgi:hypothetical protein
MSDGIGIVQPYTLLEFAVRTAKSVLALLSAIGRIWVATRRFVQVQLYRGSWGFSWAGPRWLGGLRQ